MGNAHDSRCYDLAVYFLTGTRHDRHSCCVSLAYALERAIHEWIEEEDANNLANSMRRTAND